MTSKLRPRGADGAGRNRGTHREATSSRGQDSAKTRRRASYENIKLDMSKISAFRAGVDENPTGAIHLRPLHQETVPVKSMA